MTALRILVADDHAAVLRRIRSLVESHPNWKVCGEATNGRQAVEEARRLKPDVVLTAVFPNEPPKMDAVPKWDVFQQPSFMMPFNVAGYPAMSVCSGFGAKGLPLAIQLVGKPFREAIVLRIADAFEKATAFRDRRPLAA